MQLIELLAAMNFPPAPFPPPRDAEREAAAESQLREYEDKVGASTGSVTGMGDDVRVCRRWWPAGCR